MPQGPILIFDKSSLESLNLDEAVLLDKFLHFEHHAAFLCRMLSQI